MSEKNKETPLEFYTQELEKYRQQLGQLKKKLAVSATLRLVIFLMIVAGCYYGYPNVQIVTSVCVVGVIVFIFLVTRHSNLGYQKKKLQALIDCNQLELNVIENDWSGLDTGAAFIDPIHPYSHDIDLFGERSFFQYLNRTVTAAGKNALASLLTSNSITLIKEKQDAVRELGGLAKWRQSFGATASLVHVTTTVPVILQWMQNYKAFIPKIMQILPKIISAISIVALGLLIFGVISFNVFLLWFAVGLLITGVYLKKINKLYTHAGQVKDTFDQYHKLVALIEEKQFTTSLLLEKQALFNGTPQASKVLKEFASILNDFDQRNNMLFGVVANGLFLWDLHQSYRIEKWITKHHKSVAAWFEVIAFFDAYSSLGNYFFNHPTYVFPKLVKEGPTLDAKQLGHPLLNPKKRVDNDILIDPAQFLIITGANMAGKSTFLRTIALQLVMSNIGLPICAVSCSYKPIKLFTSMRTSDSLTDDASYFFSELTQLKRIVDALEQDNYFIILDEILKGTNSTDKAEGSRKFVERLIGTRATGIIATHDLSLCQIETTFPEVQNRFFDAQIINDELYFDYTFKKGICQNMNASFLLKKMGIVSG